MGVSGYRWGMSDDKPVFSDEAVEAAAKAWDKHMGGRYTPHEVEELSDEVRVILEAAAPHIAAAAFDAGYLVAKEAIRQLDPINPYRSQA